jgi:hypothetical protein
MIRHHIAQTAAALLIASAYINPAHAQVPVGDGAHIGMQIQQWSENLIQWGNDANRWISNMKSQVMNQVQSIETFGVAATDQDKSDAEYDGLVKKLKQANPCGKIKDTTSKELCDTEQAFKIERTKVLVVAIKNAQKHVDEVKRLNQALNAAITKGAAAAGAASLTGADSTQVEEVAKIQKAILAEQSKISDEFALAKTESDKWDSKINTIHTVRVDYARTQFEGKEPGLFEKLASTAAVVTSLEVASKKYKAEIDAIKNSSETGNRY